MVVAHISEEGLVHADGPNQGQAVVQDQYFQSNDELTRFLSSKGRGFQFVVQYVNPDTLEMAIHCVPAEDGQGNLYRLNVGKVPKPEQQPPQ